MSDPVASAEATPSPGAEFTEKVSHIRHDVRSPLTNIIGFAEILVEEATAAGQEILLADFRRIRQLSGEILDRVGTVLDVEVLRNDPAAPTELKSYVLQHAPGIKTAISLLRTQSLVKESETYLEDLERIESGTNDLIQRADELLETLSISTVETVVAELKRFEESRVDSPEEITNTTFLTRQLIENERKQAAKAFRKTSIANAAILVVDDNESNRVLLSRRLSRQSYEVTTAADGLEAMEKIRSAPFDCVLLDVMMPGLNGYEVLEQIKEDEKLRHIPVVMISAMDDIDSLVRCIEHGADDYLSKPFDPVLLGARINACLEKKRLRDQEQGLIARLQEEQAMVEKLLLNVLPERIAKRLKDGESTIVDQFPEATVMFIDLVGFTPLFHEHKPAKIVHVLNDIFSAFDKLSESFGLEKIKTIGDAYLVVAGIPTPLPDHAEAIANMALAARDVLVRISERCEFDIQMRIGIDSGPVVAGIIGEKKFIYDLWGNTVNTASRMESHGEPGLIQVTDRVYESIKDKFTFDDPRTIEVKGRGQLETRFLTGYLPAD